MNRVDVAELMKVRCIASKCGQNSQEFRCDSLMQQTKTGPANGRSRSFKQRDRRRSVAYHRRGCQLGT